MAIRNNGIETNSPKRKAASVAYNNEMFLMPGTSGTAGQAIPLTSSGVVLGLCMETITSTSTNYAIVDDLQVDTITNTTDRFLMPIGAGTLTAAMENSTYNVFTDSKSLDVSASGTQFRVEKFISPTLAEVSVIKLA